jgi:hypothetical protein
VGFEILGPELLIKECGAIRSLDWEQKVNGMQVLLEEKKEPVTPEGKKFLAEYHEAVASYKKALPEDVRSNSSNSFKNPFANAGADEAIRQVVRNFSNLVFAQADDAGDVLLFKPEKCRDVLADVAIEFNLHDHSSIVLRCSSCRTRTASLFCF